MLVKWDVFFCDFKSMEVEELPRNWQQHNLTSAAREGILAI